MKSYPSNLDVAFLESEQRVPITEPHRIITAVNDRFARVAGCSRDELIGQHHNIARHPVMPAHRIKNTIISGFLPNTGYKALEAPPS